jgi:glycosyltransferase involved in cell wall biosynthesis
MKRKIVYIDNFLSAYGATPTTGETLTRLFAKQGYNVICAGTKKNKTARLLEMLGAIRRNRNAVILIATYSTSAFYFAWACACLCRLLNVKYIPCLHGGNLPERIEKNPSLCGQIFAHSYTNVVVSGYLQHYVTKYNWPSVLIPNSININAYPFLPRAIVQPKLLWVRSFHTIYNPLLAVKIVHGLSAIYSNVSLTMVGPGKDASMEACKTLAEQLGVANRIQFTGRLPVADWVKLSAIHDIFINTTNFDNLPVSVIEAMALGMPVVSTDVGGLKYLLASGVNGLLVNPGNETEFIEAIQSLITNPAFTSSISKQARQAALAFDEGHVMQLWNNVLQGA